MKLVGITYDLRRDYLAMGYGEAETAEFDRPDTIDAIETVLVDLGFRPDRIGHVKNLVKRLAQGDRWDWVFNIAEGLHGYGREALVPSLLDAYRIPYTFSDPLVLSMTLHKGIAKRVVRDQGLLTPEFAVIESEREALSIALPYPLFVKPVAEGTGKGVTSASKVCSTEQLRAVTQRLIEEYRQPVLVERFLPGREFTVGILGTGKEARAVGVLEVCLNSRAEKEVYSFVNKERCEDLVEYRLAADPEALKARSLALDAWRALGCRDGGRVDLRSDAAGNPHFLEVNPLAGLNPRHSDLPILCNLAGISFHQLIESVVRSTLSRVFGSCLSGVEERRPSPGCNDALEPS